MAQGWSDQCFFEHGNPENTSPFGYVGQNLYIRYYSKAGQPAPSAAVPIQKWYDEASQYKYADRSCSGVCGHYTQVCVCQCFYNRTTVYSFQTGRLNGIYRYFFIMLILIVDMPTSHF